jgi:hypothetical protein
MKNFLSALRPPHLFILFLFMTAAVVVLLSGYKIYVHEANQELPPPSSKAQKGNLPSMEEVRALFHQSGAEKEQLDVIAQKNLFSSDRSPWTPPDQDGGGKEEDGGNEGRGRRIRVSHQGIRLYGTTLTETKKLALVYFAPFQDKDKYRTLSEGDVARDKGERGEKVYFRVASITPESVEFEDPAGELFSIGLYDHQRQAAKQPSRDSQVQVVLGGMEEPAPVETGSDRPAQAGSATEDARQGRASQRESGAQASEGGEAAEGQVEAEQEQPESEEQKNEKARNIFELFKQLGTKGRDDVSQERKEELVEEGRMRKVETPFGTIYRPVD